MKNNIRGKFIKNIYIDEKGNIVESFTDCELGIDINDYLNEKGNYKDYQGYKYHKDRNYQIFKKFYEIMNPTKEDFDILRGYYDTYSFFEKEYDYSFVKSPSLRHLLFNEDLPSEKCGDKYFSLLDIEIRKIMNDLIILLNKTEDFTLRDDILDKITKIKNTDYIFTKKEKEETFLPLLLYKKKY